MIAIEERRSRSLDCARDDGKGSGRQAGGRSNAKQILDFARDDKRRRLVWQVEMGAKKNGSLALDFARDDKRRRLVWHVEMGAKKNGSLALLGMTKGKNAEAD